MSDDIREVMRPTPYSPRKPVGRAGGGGGGGAGRYDEGGASEGGEDEGFSAEEMERLRGEVEAANERLAAAGRDVQIEIIETDGAPLIEITLPEADEGGHVTRRVEPAGLAEWVRRLESGEGLIIDESF